MFRSSRDSILSCGRAFFAVALLFLMFLGTAAQGLAETTSEKILAGSGFTEQRELEEMPAFARGFVWAVEVKDAHTKEVLYRGRRTNPLWIGARPMISVLQAPKAGMEFPFKPGLDYSPPMKSIVWGRNPKTGEEAVIFIGGTNNPADRVIVGVFRDPRARDSEFQQMLMVGYGGREYMIRRSIRQR